MTTNTLLRLQVDLSEERVRKLEDLMRGSGIKTKRDLINNALTLLEWAVKETRAGRTIASVDEKDKAYKELVMPILSAVSQDSQM